MNTAIIAIVVLIAVGNFGGRAFADHAHLDYWLLDEYLEAYPEQVDITASFVRRVQMPAQKVLSVRGGGLKRAKALKVVVVYPGLQVSDYWRRSVSSFRARLEEIGLNFTLEEHFTKPGSDIRLQSKLIAAARESAPDYLVFTLDALRHRGMIERIMATGTTKVILQNITTPIRAFGLNQPFLYVGFDHETGARMLAKRYKAELPQGARYAIFYGTKGYVSQLRGGVFLQDMSGHPNTKLVASYYVNFDRSRSYKAAIELLSEYPNLDFIYASSTDIAHGIVDALKETRRLGSVMVNGWGGGESELSAIEAGELNFTVMRMNDDNGAAMAEAIRLDVEENTGQVPAVYSGDFVLVDQKTTKKELTALKDYAFRYSK